MAREMGVAAVAGGRPTRTDGRCWYCTHDLWSLCDNANSDPSYTQALWGHEPGACVGHSHAMGWPAGSHAEYVRVPFVDKREDCLRPVFRP